VNAEPIETELVCCARGGAWSEAVQAARRATTSAWDSANRRIPPQTIAPWLAQRCSRSRMSRRFCSIIDKSARSPPDSVLVEGSRVERFAAHHSATGRVHRVDGQRVGDVDLSGINRDLEIGRSVVHGAGAPVRP
jgi:hypothetical protein